MLACLLVSGQLSLSRKSFVAVKCGSRNKSSFKNINKGVNLFLYSSDSSPTSPPTLKTSRAGMLEQLDTIQLQSYEVLPYGLWKPAFITKKIKYIYNIYKHITTRKLTSSIVGERAETKVIFCKVMVLFSITGTTVGGKNNEKNGEPNISQGQIMLCSQNRTKLSERERCEREGRGTPGHLIVHLVFLPACLVSCLPLHALNSILETERRQGKTKIIGLPPWGKLHHHWASSLPSSSLGGIFKRTCGDKGSEQCFLACFFIHLCAFSASGFLSTVLH